MTNVDTWQVFATIASISFTLGFFGQIRTTFKTKDVSGLSILQWSIFFVSSAMFAAYYFHLSQVMMSLVSVVGSICCFSMIVMIVSFDKKQTS